MFRKIVSIILIIFIFSFIIGCAAGPNDIAKTPAKDGKIAGFWKGFWHGMIFPITFIISLFSKNVHFYEIHNNGNWYNFGFFLGVMAIVGGSHSGRRD